MYKDMDYLTGRVALPPWLLAKERKTSAYMGSKLLTAAASNFQIDIQLDVDSHFLVEAVQMVESSQVADITKTHIRTSKVKIVDVNYSRPWSDDFVPIYDAAGLGFSPRILKEPNLLLPQSTISIFVQSVDTNIRTFYVALIGRKIYGLSSKEALSLMRRLTFQYVMNIPNLNAGVVEGIATPLRILGDSDFLFKRLLASSVYEHLGSAAFNATNNHDILMNAKDLATDRSLFSAKTPIRAVAGSYFSTPRVIAVADVGGGQLDGVDTMVPFTWPKPLLLKRNTILQGSFDNLTGTATSGLALVLEGTRMFT